MEADPHLDNLVFLSLELGVPIGRLQQELTPRDLQLYRVFYKRKAAQDRNQQRMQQQRGTPRRGRR